MPEPSWSRRAVIGGVATLPVGVAASRAAAPSLAIADLSFAEAERRLASEWDVDRSIANFDAAYYGAMPRVVHADYLEHTAWVNRNNSLFLRSALPDRRRDDVLNHSRSEVAKLIGASMDEVALCTGGTEALYALITNYRPLKAGDAVIIADVDYDEMQYAMAYLEESRGARLVRLAIPEPSTDANILAAYDRVLRDTPRAKLLLLTHLSNRNGLVPPVKEIIALAKGRGVDVILDSAQAVGHLPFTVDEIGADFVGFSIHKWLAAPLGTGGIYIRKNRQDAIAPYMGNRIRDADDVRARVLTGTINYAAHLAIPAAITFHRAIGPEAKLRHLQRLRDRWITGVEDVPGIEILQPSPAPRYGAVAAFRLPRARDWESAQEMQKRMLVRHRLMVVAKRGLDSGPAMRVTPALFTRIGELDRLVAAIREEARA